MDENEDLADELNRLYQEHLLVQAQRRAVVQEVDDWLVKANKIVDPRRRFENWARSHAGQTWKQQQFKRQKGQCARCQQRFGDLSQAEIHHVRSLHELGQQANQTQNYRLLCTSCNRQLGTKFDSSL